MDPPPPYQMEDDEEYDEEQDHEDEAVHSEDEDEEYNEDEEEEDVIAHIEAEESTGIAGTSEATGSDGTQARDEEHQEEEQAEEEQQDGEDEEEGHDAPDDDDVRTFLEFTGSSDRDRARQYLTATEGNLEEAVNLFLSGAPPPTVAPNSPPRREAGLGAGLVLGGQAESSLPHLLAHLEALANGASPARSGDGNDEDHHAQMDALLSDLTEHEVNLSALARSLMVGPGFSDFMRMASQGGLPSTTLPGTSATRETGDATQDDELYESPNTTPAEARTRLDSAARGQMEAVSVVGAHVTRSVGSFTTYMEANLIQAMCSALSRVSSDSAVRVLQVLEAVVLMLCRGLDETERMTVGWFVPPRRLGSNPRRGRPKTWALETFAKTVAPNGDIAWARRLWRRRELEPDFKDAAGDGLLAIACDRRAPVEFLCYLAAIWGLDPHKGEGSLGTPMAVLERHLSVAKEKGEVDDWASRALDALPNAFVASEKDCRMAPMPLADTDTVSSELCSANQWIELASSLLKFIARSSNVSAVRRALEIVVLIVEECPTPRVLQLPAMGSLIGGALASDCKDKMVVRCGLRILKAVASAEGTESALISLCRGGAIHKLSKRSMDSDEDKALVASCTSLIVDRVKGKCDLEGRSDTAILAANALRSKSKDALSLLSKALLDVTTFEFEQSKLAEAANVYFSDPGVSGQSLLQVVGELGTPGSPMKKWRGSFGSMIDGIEGEDGEEPVAFSFATSTSSSGSGSVRFKRARHEQERRGGDSQQQNRASKSSGKVSVLDKLVECAQAVLSESIPQGLPQIVHDFPGKEEGVRALLNTIPIKLVAAADLRRALSDRASEFNMHALPLTSRRELDKQVLRTGIIPNKRYLDFCRQLVGKKIALIVQDGGAEMHLCTGFDARLGAHRLKSLVSGSQHWRVMAASKYAVLERVFDADDASEIVSHDAADSDCPEGGAMESAEANVAVSDEKDAADDAPQPLEVVASDDGKQVPVAVWWEGSAELRPGWRLGLVENASEMSADAVEINFPCPGLLIDDEIRVGSLVRLVASEELQRHPDLAQHLGESARVVSISGSQVTTYGLGGNAISSSLLARVRDSEEDGTSRKPKVGESVVYLNADGTRLDRGTVLSDDGTRLCFTVEDGVTHETRKLGEKDVYLIADVPEPSMKVPTRRIIPLSSVSRINQEHSFAVYIVPGSIVGDVPDIKLTSIASPQPRVLFTITADAADANTASGASPDWSSDDEEAPRPQQQQSTAAPPRLEIGARVEARYAGKSRWYKGVISRANADGTYDIAYDDGDTERCVAPSLVALAAPGEDEGSSSNRTPLLQAGSGQPGAAVQLDFRKVFPTQAGRTLFDSLRREDHVLRTEYNFVTRGFEHQPNFYSSFATTLELLGAGVFAQFQTYQQAETLFLRCNKFAKDADAGDRIIIRYEPDRRAHPTVMREILSAFAKAEFQRANSATAAGSAQVPKPGSRALVRVGPEASTQSLTEASKTVAWVSGTVLAHNTLPAGEEAPSVVVCTDEGALFRRVPADHVKDAPTRAPSGQSPAPQQSSARRLMFRGTSRTSGGGSASASAIGSPPRLDTPVELTRQFSVFGQTNALRHITVGERSPAPSRLQPQTGGMPSLALTTSVSPGPQSSQTLAALPGRPENQPPRIIVRIEAMVAPGDCGVALVDEDSEEDTSVFRLVFETLYNDKKNFSRGNLLRARWSFVSGGIRLIFRTRTVFPGDSVPVDKPSLAGEEEKLRSGARDALQLLMTLHRRSQGSHSVDWLNAPLSSHLRTQLRDPLSVATRVLPRWVQTLPSRAFFLFMERDRMAFVKAVTLGVSRSIAWLQEEVTGYQAKKRELAQLTVEISQLFNQAEPNEIKYKRLSQQFEKLDDEVKQIKETKFIGQLRQDLVKVNAASLLEDAMALMENHAGERSELVVQFVGDTGAGEGVTHEFYGAVAAELQKVAQNKSVPMWADPMRSTRGDNQTDLIRPLGLFPQPLLPSTKTSKRAADNNDTVLDRFRFLGRLMGQALLDDRTVPLPLAVEFFELLRQDGRVAFSRIVRLIESDDSLFAERAIGDDADVSLVQAESDSGGIVSVLSRLVATLDDPSMSSSMKHSASQALELRLNELSLRFVDPAQPLVEIKQEQQDSAGMEGSSSSSASAKCGNLGDETEIFNVPLVDAPYPAVLAFANEWSEKGKTKAQIDRALENAGHSKLARWRVLQATQAARVISSNVGGGGDDDEDGFVNRYDVAAELVPDGRRIVVDTKNVREYLAAVERHWAGSGIQSQIDATRRGLADALGAKGAATMLQGFSSEALMRMFCGEQEVKWNESDPLLGFLLPKGEYSQNSREIKMLVECLKKMSQAERSQFLSFCTALPRVPSSGLPQIKVFPPTKSRVTALVVSTSSSDGAPGGDGGSWDSQWPRLSVGDRVVLADGYRDVEDAGHGPLKPGEVGIVSNVIMRARVNEWWYHPRALRKADEEVEEEEEDEAEEQEQQDEEGGGSSQEAADTLAAASRDEAAAAAAAATAAQQQQQEQDDRTRWLEEGDVVRTNEAKGTVSSWDASTNTVHLVESASNRDFRSGRRLTVLKKQARPLKQTLYVRSVVEQCEVVQSPPLFRPKATTCVMALYLPTGYENADHMLQVFRDAFEDAKLGGLQDA